MYRNINIKPKYFLILLLFNNTKYNIVENIRNPNTHIWELKSTFGLSHINTVPTNIGSQSHIHISNIFEPTAFDKPASTSHFFEAFTESNVSGIEVIPAKRTNDTTSTDISNLCPIQLAAVTETSTHMYIRTSANNILV